MTVMRRNDYGSLTGLRQLNRMLDDAFGGWPFENQGTITSAWIPPCDIMEDGNGVRIVMEIPGVSPDDVKLSLENNMLTIRGEKRQQEERGDQERRVHRYERSYGTFERTFALPNTVDPDRIEADFDGGVLSVTLPKAEKMRPREIKVKTGVASGQGRVSAKSAEPNGGRNEK